MIWMVFSELFPMALDKVESGSAATAVTLAYVAMMDGYPPYLYG
jgi:hypothetical protein